MDEAVIKGITGTMVDKLLDVCNRNKLSPEDACSFVMVAACSTLYSIFRSMGMNDRKQIRENIRTILQGTTDLQSSLDSHL